MAGAMLISAVVSLILLVWSVLKDINVLHHAIPIIKKIAAFVYPYDQIIIPQHVVIGSFKIRNDTYSAAETYHNNSLCWTQAQLLIVELHKHSKRSVMIKSNEKVVDIFRCVKIWWSFNMEQRNSSTSSVNETERCYVLSFHKSHRKLIEGDYIKRILDFWRINHV